MSAVAKKRKLDPSVFWGAPPPLAPPRPDTDSDDSTGAQGQKKKSKKRSRKEERTPATGREQQSSSEEEEVSQGVANKRKKRSRRQKEREREERERAVRAAERTRLEAAQEPSTEREFRELLTANPLCSLHWIKFIAYFVSVAEVDRAREAAREALRTLPLEAQEDRLQVWSVWLRVEVQSKASEASVEALLKEACGNVDDFKLLSNMATIYQEASEGGLCEKAEACLKRLTKKYYAEGAAWEQLGRLYHATGCPERARDTLRRAKQVLANKPVVEVSKKFACFEFQFGHPSHGCALFEQLLRTCKHRADVWNVFVDQLIKHQLHERARTELHKMCRSTLKLDKLRTIFEKTINFETKHFPKSLTKTREELSKILEALEEKEMKRAQ